MRKNLLALLLLLCCFLCRGTMDDAGKKLCWAHYVGWGFPQLTYDQAGSNPAIYDQAVDRSLLGRYLQCDSGLAEGAGKQIRCAMSYGFDGFCVDVRNPHAYSSILSRFYKAAEGTNFRIALCIDTPEAVTHERITEYLGEFIRKFRNHPNSSHVNGKMVIFAYNLGRDMSAWGKIRNTLREKGLDAYYIHRAMHETSVWNKPETIAASLAVNNGLYDFGCNGFTPEVMIQRIRRMRNALDKHRPDGLLVAGVAPGYLGRGVGNYRPFLGTGTLRANWEAILANKVDWVCITTWNDYTEQTHFEPSVVNRDALCRINREYLAKWRGSVLPDRPAAPILSYHEEVIAGDDLTLEILSLPYTEKNAFLRIRFMNEAGDELEKFRTEILKKNTIDAHVIRIPHERMRNLGLIRLQAALCTNEKEDVKWSELHPVMRRFERVESQRTVRIPFDELSQVPIHLRLETDSRGVSFARIKLLSWTAAGKIELIRNGYPAWESEVNHTGKAVCSFRVPLPAPHSPEDVYFVRYTNVSDGIGFSNALIHSPEKKQRRIIQPVIVTGSDFDENWPFWQKRISRLPAPILEKCSIPEHRIFSLLYQFDEGDGKILFSSSGWHYPCELGNGKRYRWKLPGNTSSAPIWERGNGPNGETRNYLRFNGNNIAVLPVRTTPAAIFTLEMLIKPDRNEEEMILFGEQKSFQLALDGRKRPRFLLRHSCLLASETAVPTDSWSHIAVVCDGKFCRMYLNAKIIAEQPAPSGTFAINSEPAIGNAPRSPGKGYAGLLAGFTLEGTARSPEDFQLKKHTPAAKRK